MLKNLQAELLARGVNADITADPYSASGQKLNVRAISVRQASGQLYVSFCDLGACPFDTAEEAADFIASQATSRAREYVS